MIELYGQQFDPDNPKSTFFHGDCIKGMKVFPDGYFDLAVVDPPYGDGLGGQRTDLVKGSTVTKSCGGDTTDSGDGSTATSRQVNHAWGGAIRKVRESTRKEGHGRQNIREIPLAKSKKAKNFNGLNGT